jgi:hypothetical protein
MNGPKLTKFKISRRKMVLGSAAIAMGLGLKYAKTLLPAYKSLIPGKMVGPQFKIGHLLRLGAFNRPKQTETRETVIIGGGIAGLAAGWRLQKNNFEDFTILELESAVGGNSSSSKNSTSAYPWGAHYVPLPSSDATYVHLLFEELGIIKKYDGQGLPVFDEFAVVSDPHERLYIHGRWQEGVLPDSGLGVANSEDFKKFKKIMAEFATALGKDGKPAFTIPLEKSSTDPKFTRLDQISFKDFLDSKNLSSKYLRWYANYCCRDDFGLTYDQTSAWAGIHYFASRTGKGSGLEDGSLLTWPEGNGHIVNALKEKLSGKIRTNSLVSSVSKLKDGRYSVVYSNPVTGGSKRIISNSVIYSAPRFTAPYVIDELNKKKPSYLKSFQYAPWMVANITLSKRPASMGTLCWDNVNFYGKSLGYVNANHQSLESHPGATVLTFYLPLTELSPIKERQRAMVKTHAEWSQLVVNEMKIMHPDIAPLIENIDINLWGHGMIAPQVGFIWGKDRQQALNPIGGIFFAHSDMSGLSLFEEAFYRGVVAAEASLSHLNRPLIQIDKRGLS